MKAFTDGPWGGASKIILGIDIGITESAVSFAYLYPGGTQSLHRVTAWPGQEAAKGESTVPTLVYYDSRNKAVAFGAEALKPEIEEMAEDEQWQLARHFRLHLHANAVNLEHNIQVQPLPGGASLLTVYTDFMGYLLKHAKEYFESRIIHGQAIWESHHDDMTVVLTHPNSWGLMEQSFLRQAAVAAKYVSSSKANSHIQFVNEAEATVHFFTFYGDLHNRLKADMNFVVCDAGKYTVDTAVYRVVATSPMLEIEEKIPSAYIQAGSALVCGRFETHLASVLDQIDGWSAEDRAEYLRQGVKDFERAVLKEFDDIGRQYLIDLGAGRLLRADLGIRRGRLIMEGRVIKDFFNECTARIIEGIHQLILGIECKHILLLGVFSDSLYLRRLLVEEFGKNGCSVNILNDSALKTGSDGAVIWFAKRSVISRAPRASYGVDINVPYDPSNPTHQGRRIYRHAAGYDYLINQWSQLVSKGVALSIDAAVRETYWCSYRTANPYLEKFKITLFAYTGSGTPDPWIRDSQGNMNEGFEETCEVQVDLDTMRKALKHRVGHDGDYYYLLFTLVFMFGRTELEVLAEWEQDGEVRTMPTRIKPIAPSRR